VKPPSGARGVPLIEVLQDRQIGSLNPDSAVPADAMSEEQTFRSEVNGSLPLSGHRSSVVQDEI
jgi:hypothetical protein